ncbi:MAG: MFS transporter [Planctomycetota bacterium]|nr:MFS transporter [Planctomycetota bacterium]
MPDALRTSGRMMWTIIVLVCLLCLVNYLDRVVISFAIEPIRQDFGVDNTGFGLAMTLFAAGAIAVNLLSGLLLDRFGVRRVWLVGLLVWTIAMFMLGMVEYWWLFLLFRVVLGLGEGVNFPAMNRAVRDWVPPRHASKVTAACLIGVPAAFLIGGPLFGWLIEAIGWRGTFKLLSGAGFVLMVAMLLFYRNPVREETDASSRPDRSWLALLKDPTLLATSWSFFGFGVILYFGLTWIPGYFEQTFGEKLSTIGWFSTLPWGLAIILMQLVGWWSDALHRRSGNSRTSRVSLILGFQLLAAMCFIPLAFVTTPGWAVAWLTLGVGCSMAPNAPYYSIISDLYRERTGAATGIMITFFSASGLLMPVIVGLLTDLNGSFAAAFILMASIVASGALGMFLFARPQTITSP